MHPKKSTVFPFHPWDLDAAKEQRRRYGIVLWIPDTIEELVKTASEHLEFPDGSYILLSEDAGKIIDVDMINDGQKLYLIGE